MAHAGGYLTLHCYIVYQKPFERKETTCVCWKTSLSFYSLHLTDATRIYPLLQLLWRVSTEKSSISHGCRNLRGCIRPLRVNKVLYTLPCSWMNVYVFIFECFHVCEFERMRVRVCVCMRGQMAAPLMAACVLVSCNSRGWMEDRLSGSQGRVDRLLKTVERDTTASAHTNSQNRHSLG